MVGESQRQHQLLQEVAAVYDWIDRRCRQEPARAGRCQACGACCDFVAYDHRLYVTPPELAYLAAKLDVREFRAMPTGRCPYQEGPKCTVHEQRFAACRIFCCSGDPDFQSDLSEEALRRLTALCEEFQVPYRYQDLATALAGFSSGTSRSAAGSCPGDREG
jgi:Fe-S-cluster containining protein